MVPSPHLKAQKDVIDKDVIPEAAKRDVKDENFHIGVRHNHGPCFVLSLQVYRVQ